MSNLREIFEAITERYQSPVRIGSRCESRVYYRVEDLSRRDVESCAEYIAERVQKVCSPILPNVLIALPGSFSGLAEILSRELAAPGETLEVISIDQISGSNGRSSHLKGAYAMLVNDVITTARSCLEVHTKATVIGASVLCWAALIDRTFGPGPVPVIASFTGEPVRLLDDAIP